MKLTQTKKTLLILSLLLGLTAKAELLLNIASTTGNTTAPASLIFEIDVDTPEMDSTTNNRYVVEPSGSLIGVSGTFSMTFEAFTYDTGLNDPAFGGTSIPSSPTSTIDRLGTQDAWSVGGTNTDYGEMLTVSFDFSGLTLNGNTLELSGFTTGRQANGESIRYIVDGVSNTSLTAAAGTSDFSPGTALSSGSQVGFTIDNGGDTFSLGSLTLTVVPEPSSAVLLLIGTSTLLVLRKRRPA